MGTVITTTSIPERSPLLNLFLLRSGAVVILTSAARSGGEVRITEAERPRHVNPGQRGCQAGIAARSACNAGATLRSRYAAIRWVLIKGRLP